MAGPWTVAAKALSEQAYPFLKDFNWLSDIYTKPVDTCGIRIGDTHVGSMQGDATDEQGSKQGSVQCSMPGDTHVCSMQGSMLGDTPAASIQGDATGEQGSMQGAIQGSMQADTH
eukprot:15017833-Alexandrium_andersonii.AAC.1